MPSKSLSKVQKHIAKKKGSKATSLHANSRDSQRLQRASARDDKLHRLASARDKANRPYLERIHFFQTLAASHPAPFTSTEVHDAIATYLSRHSDELATLKVERRPGRPASTKEDQLKQQQAQEENEFVSGFWMPDMEDEKNIETLKSWGGDWISLGTMRFTRVNREGGRRGSTWPPRGNS